MKKFSIYLIIILSLISCNFFGPIDNNIQTKNVEFNKTDIIGTWKLDDFSYKYLAEKENLDSIHIQFNFDSTFQLNNSKDLFKEKEDVNDIINGKLDNLMTEGEWKKYGSNEIHLFNINSELNINLKILKKDNDYQIWYFFGDPDSGERLRFLKQ